MSALASAWRSRLAVVIAAALAWAVGAQLGLAEARAEISLVGKCAKLASLPPGDRAVIDALVRAFAENGRDYHGCQDLAQSFRGLYISLAAVPPPNVGLLREARDVDSVWLECRSPPAVSTISALASLPLVSFMLTNDTASEPGCGVVDLAALAAVRSLEKLHVSNVDVVSVEPLAKLDRLIDLSVSSSRIHDLAPIHQLVQLRSLYLHGNRLTRLLDLMSLVNLTELDLSFNEELPDLLGVQYMTNLRKLSLNHGSLTGIEPLGSLVWLEELVLNRNRLVDIGVIGGLPRLRVVGLYGNRVVDISALAKLQHLEEVMLGKNPVRDYLPIAKPGLRKLELEGATHVTDWSFLSRMTDLEELVLSRSGIVDLDPLVEALAALPRFRRLELDSNRIVDFSPLRKLKALRDLGIMDNGLTSLATLVGNVDLDELGVGHDPALDYRALPKIRTRRVRFGGVRQGSVPCPAVMQCFFYDF